TVMPALPPAPLVTGSPPSDSVMLRAAGAFGSEPGTTAEPAAAVAAPTGCRADAPAPAPAPLPPVPRSAAAPAGASPACSAQRRRPLGERLGHGRVPARRRLSLDGDPEDRRGDAVAD